MSRMFNSFKNGRLCNFVEHNAVGVLFIKSEHFAQMPRDGFSFAVFIGSQPHFLGFLRLRLQFSNEFFLFIWNLIVGFQRIHVDANLLFLQITNVSIARHHFVVLTQKTLYSLGLGRTLHNH